MRKHQSIISFPRYFRVIILFTLGVYALASASGQTLSANDLNLPDVSGRIFHLADHHPRMTLVAFVSLVPDTISTPSLRETVFLSSMKRQYEARGLYVVAIDISQARSSVYISRQTIADASADWHIDFPVLEDVDERLGRQFAAHDSPTIFLLDGSGKVTQSWRGYTRPAELARGIESVLGGSLSQLPKLAHIGR